MLTSKKSLIEYPALLPSTLEDQFPSSLLFSLFIYRLSTCRCRVLETKRWLIMFLHLLLPLISIFSLRGLPLLCQIFLISLLTFRTWTSPSCPRLLPMPWKNYFGWCRQMNPCGSSPTSMGEMSLILIPTIEFSPSPIVAPRLLIFALRHHEILQSY
ncbi:hypothetical protein VIGAN_01001100 [Vigna angularis var. angularis]|uniref:Uncharacterized protein n=1 Tax=Vigna angularis var. angularis TaxID=157739 RepID=A0A0S3QW95_PHAAN|nr:hypothetical protein VIGAN_01001100 [Vigna angularis var. angularis]